LNRPETRHDNHDCRRMERARLLQNLQPMRASFIEVKVANHQFRLNRFNSFDRRVEVVERKNLMAFRAQKLGDHLHHRDFVVYDQHFGHRVTLERKATPGKTLQKNPDAATGIVRPDYGAATALLRRDCAAKLPWSKGYEK
jgi:hypothetical protein